jgi:hypothetical protein
VLRAREFAEVAEAIYAAAVAVPVKQAWLTSFVTQQQPQQQQPVAVVTADAQSLDARMLRDREHLRVQEVIYATKVDLATKAAWMNSFNGQQQVAAVGSANQQQQAAMDAMMRQVREQLRLKEVIYTSDLDVTSKLNWLRDSPQ